MEDKIRQGDLYDYYGTLLNEHQKKIYEDYVLADLSLGEIAENHEISRQAVHDLIRRCTKEMEKYEERLHVIQKAVNLQKNLNESLVLVEKLPISEERDSLREILKSLTMEE